jgi:hypothetical protein
MSVTRTFRVMDNVLMLFPGLFMFGYGRTEKKPELMGVVLEASAVDRELLGARSNSDV